MLALKVEENSLRPHFDRFYRIEVTNWGFDFRKNDYTEKRVYPLEKCTKSHFPSDVHAKYDKLELDTSYCFPKD